MSERAAAWIAWPIGAACLVSVTVALVIGPGPTSHTPGDLAPTLTTMALLLAFAAVGALLAARRPANPIGWLLLGADVCYAVASVSVTLDPDETNAVAQWVSSWAWGVGLGLALTLPVLLFPTGTLPSARWRPAAWLAVVAVAGYGVGAALAPGAIGDTGTTNPFGVGGIGGTIFPALRLVGLILIFVAGVLGLASLVVRFRRGDPQVRAQLRWLLFSVVLVALSAVASGPITAGMSKDFAVSVQNAITSGAMTLIPVAIAIAVLRYRLYDIDLVIRKAVVYAALAAFVTAVYVAIVVGIGTTIGNQRNLALSIAATAVVAVAFQPVRERANRLANRLVYGKRATPYEVLARFGDRVAGTYASEDVLPRIARTVADGTGAERVEVWLHRSDAWRAGAVWPADVDHAPGSGGPRSSDGPVAPSAGSIEVRHLGELLGAIEVRKPASEPLTPAEVGLLEDLAGQAGLVLSNARLTAELQERVDALARRTEELRDSRRRIVLAHDTERRRLERNIHDGAQQHLVALAVKLRLAKAIIGKDPARASALLRELKAQIGDAIETLTSLALGIYPPILEERGIAAAIESQARVGSIPVTVDAGGVGRAPIETEAAVYFCCLEAIQNAAKYAEPSRVTVKLGRDGDSIAFEVADDGGGFDPAVTPPGSGLRNMADRASTLGGSVSVTSSPGRGTSVRGTIPLTEGAVA